MKLKIISMLCAAVLLTTTTVHANTTINETDLVSNSKSVDIAVTAHINSAFTVSLPAAVELTKSDSNYTYSGFVGAKGDILATDALRVSPGKNVTLYDVTNRPEGDITLGGEGYDHREPVTATISQPVTIWKTSDLSDEYRNTAINITAPDLKSGKWEGALNFNIRYIEKYVNVDATNESGENINAYASAITGTKKDQLLSSLVESGAVESADAVDQLIEVKSDDFEGLADTTFDLTGIATEGEKVAILHLNHNNEWELVGIETVGAENKVSSDFSSYSPVAFVKVNENGSFDVIPQIVPGLYDANDNRLATWSQAGIDVSKNYTVNDYKTSTTSGYYVLKNNYPATAKVIIPDSVTSIGDYAFEYCSGLTSVTIPSSVTSIGNNAFYYCSGLTSVTIPNSVTSIGGCAFEYCTGLTSVTIPDSVTSISDSVFYRCENLTSVTIPDSVTSIGNSALAYCFKLTSVTIPNSVTSIGNLAFYNCEGLTSVTIPDSVTSIGASTFGSCFNLASVTIPNSVTSIEQKTFEMCTSLTSVTIPDSVTTIREYAFQGCSGLTSVTIPDSVTSIRDWAFSSCTSLTSVTIPDSVTSIGQNAFENVFNILYNGSATGAKWGAKYLNAYTEGDFVYSDSSKAKLIKYLGSDANVTIPDSVTSIGSSAFYDCTSLASITIPNGVTSIGYAAFRGCSNLTTITIPDSVTSISGEAFRSCSSLTAITIPDRVTSIGGSAFYDCSNLTSVTIPDGITDIYSDTFRNCTSLTSITIPDSVTSISEFAFASCISLTSVTIPGSVTSIGQYAFYDVPHIYYTGKAKGRPWGAKAIN